MSSSKSARNTPDLLVRKERRHLRPLLSSILLGLCTSSTLGGEEEKIHEDDGILDGRSLLSIDSFTTMGAAYTQFLAGNPEYRETSAIDYLRKKEYTRLGKSRETYVDYMGGGLYPESLVRAHTDLLSRNVMGNTHSVSNSSGISSRYAAEARAAVLQFFDAPADYTVIFTANATGALKLVGESYPFEKGSAYILPSDSHNSINGIRQYARHAEADVQYLSCRPTGGIDLDEARAVLTKHQPRNGKSSLYAISGMSNISNSKTPLDIALYASELGYHTLLDAAALAPTTRISLRETPVDAMAISFYKMFGYPTGIGALVVKNSFLSQLRRPWFAGGTVDIVQVPGALVTMAPDLHEQFEDGTINYLGLPPVTTGLKLLTQYQPMVINRLGPLFYYLTTQLQRLRYDTTHQPVVKILSRLAGELPNSNFRWQEAWKEMGATISLLFFDPNGKMLPNSFIEHAAAQNRISLRTGCVCNPGGAAAILGIEENMALLEPGVTLKDFECRVGRELGVVRISLGLVTNFEDVWRVLQFARSIGDARAREKMWQAWQAEKAAH